MAKHLKLLNFKASEEEIAAWDAFANRTVHRNRSRWIRDTLNQASSPTTRYIKTNDVIAAPKAVSQAKILMDKALLTQSSTSKCERRLPKGAFCKECGKIHA